MKQDYKISKNVIMGENAYISWGQISSKPFIPQSASDVGAISSTYIDANGVWTGYINADTIVAGTITADKINGGVISGVGINVTADVTVGNNIYLGQNNAGTAKRIIFNSAANITAGDGFWGADMSVSANEFSIQCDRTTFMPYSTIDFTNTSVIGLYARFG